jgi:thymidylate kinase
MTELALSTQRAFEARALSKLFLWFANHKVRYAVLRNFESLPDSVGARDIDILVHREDLEKAKNVIAELAETLAARFAKVFHDDMITQIILFRRLETGDIFELKIDLLHNRQVFGVQLLSFEAMMEGLWYHNGIPVVAEHIRFLDKWLFNLFVGHPTDEKYDADFSVICRNELKNLTEILTPMLSAQRKEALVKEIAVGRASAMPPLTLATRIARLALVALRDMPQSLMRLANFFWHRLRNLLAPQGIFISVSGPDGSGKTTVIDMVISQLGTIYGEGAVTYAHFRPTVLPRIAQVAKRAGAVKKVDVNYDQPHRAKPSGLVGSAARLGYYWLDYMGGYFRSVRPVLKRREVMLFDRYYYDMIADSFRSRIALPMPFLRAMGRLLPLPHYAFFIDVDPEEIYRRKQELTFERIVELNSRYGDLVDLGWLISIDNNGAPHRAAATIIDHIVADRHAKACHTLAQEK